MVEAKVPHHNMIDVLFEPNPRFKNKALFIANTLLHIQDKRIKISIINATDRQQTFSKGTKLGITTQIAASISVTMTLNDVQERIPKGKEANITTRLESRNMQMITSHEEQHQCRECKQYFDTGNELFKRLRIKCYSEEIHEQINKLTDHINDDNQQEQMSRILWKYGKLFDISESSKIDILRAIQN
ncbi:unnamed protein product [Rotaria magnacalcarata]|uniref:Uncharacterized protein n=1 Tax=Rotaria magnacalcarata TaxID=392030 RepID=A0A815D1I4_9BILA|nr:unnamed protein product [Rotaria magnacalcarata]CAF1455797.1 unnamed protein product [Rotaria magnacalcarata]CAF4291541.1 unnamed protein product [Rotaria magnacalcarata]CAF5037279.1 unnamed protein product [Rotaria magnacalcarata]